MMVASLCKKLPQGWHLARFDEFLQRIERKITIDDSASYNCVGVRWYGNGAFIREQLLGMNIARKQQWIIKTGDVVYNKLFAWKGSFAIADNSVNDCIVSDKFPTYEINPEIIDPSFLEQYFRTPQVARRAQDLSKGAAAISKLTLNPPQFWDLTIPLPSIEEQRRIVAKIKRLVAKINEAQTLRGAASKETSVLTKVQLNEISKKFDILDSLGAVLHEKPRNGWSARCDNAEDGTPVLTLKAITGYRYNSSAWKKTSLPTDSNAHYWLNPGDLLITRSNTPEFVGHAAIYNGLPERCIYSDLMMRVPINEQLAEKKFVLYWLQTPIAREFIERNAKGTSPTMKKISQGTVMRIPFPSKLSIKEQRRIVEYLDGFQTKVDELKVFQAQTSAELDALMPSILDKAFKGEL